MVKAVQDLRDALAYAGHELAEATHLPRLVAWLGRVLGGTCPCGACARE